MHSGGEMVLTFGFHPDATIGISLPGTQANSSQFGFCSRNGNGLKSPNSLDFLEIFLVEMRTPETFLGDDFFVDLSFIGPQKYSPGCGGVNTRLCVFWKPKTKQDKNPKKHGKYNTPFGIFFRFFGTWAKISQSPETSDLEFWFLLKMLCQVWRQEVHPG